MGSISELLDWRRPEQLLYQLRDAVRRRHYACDMEKIHAYVSRASLVRIHYGSFSACVSVSKLFSWPNLGLTSSLLG